jgi:3-deoxy-D-manno-octulosonic-acid transferase
MMIFYFYNLMNLILLPVYVVIFFIRIFKNKDTVQSLLQRIGMNLPERPKGDLIWIHAASVGESMVAITLVQAINKIYPDKNFLITTGTLSSADILKKWLPKNAVHQFVPLDNLFFVRKFLKYWQPSIGIFIESELWPCLIMEAAKQFDLLLVNARLSDKSYKIWQKHTEIFQNITKNFKNILVQSKSDLVKYKNLGCKNVKNLGNLKFANKELEVDKSELIKLQKLVGDRQVFVASSTHKEDEEIILEIIKDLKNKKLNYYPIVILRHPERKEDIKKHCSSLGLSFLVRSENSAPKLDSDLYIVDSFGELGLFYSIAFVSFVGGSFKRGGHNLMEPAFFDNVIILGPDMSNFQNIADEMIEQKAALQISGIKELAQKIEFFFSKVGEKEAKEFSKNARNFVASRKDTIDNYIIEIGKFLR